MTRLSGLLPTATISRVFDVYILTGQSNLLGTTNLETPLEPDADPTDAQVNFFWSNVSTTNIIFPSLLYGNSGGAITNLQMQQGGGANPNFWGPEYGMARKLVAAGHTDVLIIKASRGGGRDSFWDKATFEENNYNGNMWGYLLNTADACLAAIGEEDMFEFKGLTYLQGESNNTTETAVTSTRLHNLIDNLKTHINATYPNSADNMHTVVGEIAASESNANRIQNTQLQMSLSEGNEEITFVPTNDLPLKSDDINFGRDAKLAVGERFAEIFIGVQEQPNGIVGDVNQDGIISTGTGKLANDDVTAFNAGWQSETVGLTNLKKTLLGDLNLSGKTTLSNAIILHEALQTQGLKFPFDALNSVPESGSCCLLSVGGLLSLFGNRTTTFRQGFQALESDQ